MSGFNSLINSVVVPEDNNSTTNNPNKRHILKEYDLQDGLTDVVVFKDSNKVYCCLHDIAGFIPSTLFAYTTRGWKKVSYISDYNSWFSDLLKDDISYLEWEETH